MLHPCCLLKLVATYHGEAEEVLPRRRGPDVTPLVADESPEVLVASQVVDDVHRVLGELSAPKPRHQPDQTKLDGQAGEPEGHELQ